MNDPKIFDSNIEKLKLVDGPIIYGGNCGVCYTLVYSEKGDSLTIVCLKRYVDYPEIKFYKEYIENSEFNSEKEAIDYLNSNFEREDIDPKFYKVRKKIEKKIKI